MANTPPPTAAATPDLASILKSLASFSQAQTNQVQAPPPTQPLEPQPAPPYQPPRQNYEAIHSNPQNIVPQQQYGIVPQFPPQYPPHQQPYPVPQQQQPQQQYGHPGQNFGCQQQQQQQRQPYAQTQVEPKPQPRKVVDPATIIDWSAGLRCVMRTVASHDQMLLEIRRMIKSQHAHEEEWWQNREALRIKQTGRKEEKAKLAAVLRAVGSTAPEDTTTAAETATEEAIELRVFDTKIYRAQVQMVKEFSAKLKAMGVPFFGTRSELVRVRGKEGGMGLDGAGDGDDGKIDEEVLIGLQRKMLVLLEDLCRDGGKV